MLAQFGPITAKTYTLPGNHGPRLDKNQSIPPPRSTAREPRPENTVLIFTEIEANSGRYLHSALPHQY